MFQWVRFALLKAGGAASGMIRLFASLRSGIGTGRWVRFAVWLLPWGHVPECSIGFVLQFSFSPSPLQGEGRGEGRRFWSEYASCRGPAPSASTLSLPSPCKGAGKAGDVPEWSIGLVLAGA